MLTLIVDSNWLLMSRASILFKKFSKDEPQHARQQAKNELQDLLARSINVVLNRFPVIDNIVLVKDGGSWRKNLTPPKTLTDVAYKGNRVMDNEIDWNSIYEALNNLIDKASNLGITVTQYSDIEGDDWIWYWTNRLNSEGENCLIWSSDNDLKQLININKDTNAYTAWYNDKQGLFLHDSINDNYDPIDFFMRCDYVSPSLEALKTKAGVVNFINPETIVIDKIICGDASDNIKPIIQYKKNNRNQRITENDWSKISNRLNINSLNDLLGNKPYIIETIKRYKKWEDQDISIDHLSDMIDYNTKLVCLNEDNIPRTLIQVMNQSEYKKFDIGYLRSNYKVLLNDNDDILELFNSILG